METQTTIFEYISPTYRISKPIRLIELFAGIGSQAKALKNLGVEFEHWKVIEFDRHAIDSYNAVHDTHFQVTDIRNVHASDLAMTERNRWCYIMTYSFPCQDLSLAGKQKGMQKGSDTRSGLLWEVERILDECNGELPEILLMENVPQVIGKKNISDFQLWRDKLEKLGYSNYVQILNAKDYGIPQNRARCFMVSILGDWNYRFPEKQPLNLCLKDLLEESVDDKYILPKSLVDFFVKHTEKQIERGNGFRFETVNDKQIGKTITTCPVRMETNFIAIPEKTKKGYAVATGGDGIYINRPHQKRGVVQKGMVPTLKTSCADIGVVVDE